MAADRAVGELVRFLSETDLADSTMIVLVSDHGEEFWDSPEFEAKFERWLREMSN